MPSLYRYEEVTSFMEFFVKGKNNFKNISHNFFFIISFALLQSNYFNFLRSFQIILFLTNFTQIPLNRYEKVTSFMEVFVKGKNNLKNISHNCFFIISFALLQSNYFNFLRSFQIILFLTNFTQIPLNRYEKVTSFMEVFVKGKNNLKNISHNCFFIISFALLQSNYFNFLRSFQIILFLTNFTQIPLNRYEKVTLFMEFSVRGKLV